MSYSLPSGFRLNTRYTSRVFTVVVTAESLP